MKVIAGQEPTICNPDGVPVGVTNNDKSTEIQDILKSCENREKDLEER